MRIVEMARNDIKNSSLLKTKFLIYAFNGRTLFCWLSRGFKPATAPLQLVNLLIRQLYNPHYPKDGGCEQGGEDAVEGNSQ